MKNTKDIRAQIQAAIQGFAAPAADFTTAATNLVEVLGYGSERGDVTYSAAEFTDEFTDHTAHVHQRGEMRERFRKKVKSVYVVAQTLEEDIRRNIKDETDTLLEPTVNALLPDRQKSFVFLAVNTKTTCKRADYAEITRLLNRYLPMPLMVIFYNEGKLTFAFAPRRPRKGKAQEDNIHKEVLGRVSLLCDIDCKEPHHGHLDTLSDLSLKQLAANITRQQKATFDDIYMKWREILNVENLNNRFYHELAAWFDNLLKLIKEGEASIPQPTGIVAEAQIIRMITRILFIWFIKEKGLVAEELFDEGSIRDLLKDYTRDNKRGGNSDYYRAILQNLFFATLNAEIDNRDFGNRTKKHHNVPAYYRYRDMMSNSAKLIKLFSRTPFINGGLFDSLDEKLRREDKEKYYERKIECFSDPDPKQGRKEKKSRDYNIASLHIPNAVFFDEEKGLFPLLNRYKFTVEESTPVEKEVALDPELLGRVFENLLARYTLETKEIVRRNDTGSFYTPREIVDYMVNESLVNYFLGVVPADAKAGDFAERLHDLLDYQSAEHAIAKSEKLPLVEAIAKIKIIDPAVGSGAFPMGIMQKLVMVLQKIDGKNVLWRKVQQQKAEKEISDLLSSEEKRKIREERLKEINDTFHRYAFSNFGRKLYLMQNNIYGVDIQPVACLITKLRFFITLAIEQDPDDDFKSNYGIRPLPNLETRFIAADTLAPLDTGRKAKAKKKGHVKGQKGLADEKDEKAVEELRAKIKQNHEKHFHARTYAAKERYMDAEEALKKKLVAKLTSLDFPQEEAQRYAAWDAFNQNTSADWFDAELMFHVKDGFDVVIGNPPYIQLEANKSHLNKKYAPYEYRVQQGRGDIYHLFFEKGHKLLNEMGHLVYITSNSYMRSGGGRQLRNYLRTQSTVKVLIDFGEMPVFEAGTDPAILLLKKSEAPANAKIRAAVIKQAQDIDNIGRVIKSDGFYITIKSLSDDEWALVPESVLSLIAKMRDSGISLNEYVDGEIYRGITTGLDEAFVIDEEKRQQLIREDKNSAKLIKPYLMGREIKCWHSEPTGKYIIFATTATDIDKYPAIKSHLSQYREKLEARSTPAADYWHALQMPTTCHVRFSEPKLVYNKNSQELHSYIDAHGLYIKDTVFVVFHKHLEYLLGVLNSELMDFYYRHTFPPLGDPWNPYKRGRIQFRGERMRQVPVIQANAKQRDKIAALVKKILADPKGGGVSQLEAKIDDIVYALYDITDKEKALVKEWQAKRRGLPPPKPKDKG